MPMGTPDDQIPQSSDLHSSTDSDSFTTSESARNQNYKFDPMTGERLQPETPTVPTRRYDPMTGEKLTPSLPDKANQTADVNKTQTDEPKEDEFTHYVHLADGRVIKAMGSFTHYFDSDKHDAVAVPVIGVYPR